MQKQSFYLFFFILSAFIQNSNAQIIKKVFKYLDKKEYLKAEKKLNTISKEENKALFNLAQTEVLAQNLDKNIKECLTLLNPHHDYLANYQGKLEGKFNIQDRYKKTYRYLEDYILSNGSLTLIQYYFNTTKKPIKREDIVNKYQNKVLEKIKKSKDLSDFNKILDTYKNFKPTAESNAIKVSLFYKEISEQKSITAFEKFIQKNPNHPLADSAQQKIYYLAFEKAKKKNSIMSYNQYLQTYPNAPKEILDEIEDAKLFNKDYLMGKFEPSSHAYFVLVPRKYRLYKSSPLFLHKETYTAFIAMAQDALKEGIIFEILSGTRNFWIQKMIWERHWKNNDGLTPEQKARKILEYSSMPGTSRHHWGTDIDINSVTPTYFDQPKGQKEYAWLLKNAHKYGFFQAYDGIRSGYKEEKWHWSYRPVSEKCLKYYLEKVSYNDIKGYTGADMSKVVKVISNFVKKIAD